MSLSPWRELREEQARLVDESQNTRANTQTRSTKTILSKIQQNQLEKRNVRFDKSVNNVIVFHSTNTPCTPYS